MPPRNLLRSFLALWMLTAVVLFIGSVETIREGLVGSSHANPHVMLLGGIEAVAALLFLVPYTFRVGAVLLLLTIAVAFVVHATLGQFRGDFLLYGTVVFFVMVHGPLTREQLRVAIRGPQ